MVGSPLILTLSSVANGNLILLPLCRILPLAPHKFVSSRRSSSRSRWRQATSNTYSEAVISDISAAPRCLGCRDIPLRWHSSYQYFTGAQQDDFGCHWSRR